MTKLFLWVKIFSLIGILLACYLLFEQYTQPEYPPCTINANINCDAIISGAVAKTFGVPTPLYGLIGYIAIFLSAYYKSKKLLLVIATFGLLFCGWIGYREIFELKVICPICLICQSVMITIFSLSLILRNKSD